MMKSYGVQKLVSRFSLTVVGLAMLLGQPVFAANVKSVKSKNTQTATAKPSKTQSISLKNMNLTTPSRSTTRKDVINRSPILLAANSTYKKKSLLMQNSINADLALDEDDKVISGGLSLDYSRSMVDFQDGSRSEGQGANLNLSGKLSDNFTASVRASVVQDNRNSESIQNGLSDTSISLSMKRSKISDSLKGGFSLSTMLPTSKYSSEFQDLESILGISYGVGFNEGILMDGLNLSFSIGATRLFHRYETDKSGEVLNQYSLREGISASYSYKKLSFSFDLTNRHAWTYRNNVKQAYEASQEVSYSIMPTWGISLGHTNSEAWLKPNGQDSNLKLINENSSIVYVSTSVMF